MSNISFREILLLASVFSNLFFSYLITKALNQEQSSFLGGSVNVIDTDWIISFVITFAVLMIITGVLLFILFKKYSGGKVNSSSRIITPKQIKREQYVGNIDFLSTRGMKKYSDPRNLVLSRNIKLNLEKFYQHVMVISATGTGKGVSLLIPQLLALAGKISAFVTDPKAELFRKTSKVLKAKGFIPILLKLDNPEVSIGYNLLQGCRDEDDVRKLSEGILGQGEWSDLSKELLNAFLLRQYDLGGTVSDAVQDMSDCPQDIYELELDYFSEEKVSEKTRRSFNKFAKLAGSSATVSSIFATVQSKTTVFEFDKIKEIQNKKHFDITKMRSNRVVLFVSYPEEDSAVYQPFLSSFYYQCFNLLKGHDSVNEEKGDMSGYPILFLLDEFANIGKIPSFDNLISTIRSKKMAVEIFLQNIEQLNSVYGKDVASTILSNTSTKLTMYGNTEETNKLFSSLAGKREVQQISHSDSGKGKMSRSISTQEKSVISTDELRRLKGHQILIITSNLKPVIDDKNFYYMDNIDFFVHKHFKMSDENKQKLSRFLHKIVMKKK